MKKLLFALLLATPGFGFYVHPSMQEAIDKNEQHMAGHGQPEPDFIWVKGVKQYTGFKPTNDFYQGASVINFKSRMGMAVPATYDYRTFSYSPVRGQIQGSCWAEGNGSAFELNWNAVLGAKLVFAVQDVIDCSGFGSARAGGQLSMEYDLKGLAFESDYKYTGRDGRCNKTVARQYPLKEVSFLRGENGDFPTQPELQMAILKYGAMEVCGSAGALGEGGRQDTPRNGSTNHCYALAGWVDGKSLGWLDAVYFLIKNSWGDGSKSELSNGRSWGDKGWGMYRLSTDGVKLKGSVITEIQVGYAGPILPPGPVEFTMESTQVSLKVVIAQGATYNEAAARKMLKGALDSLDKGE